MLEKNDYDKISDGVKIDPLKVQQYSRLISQNEAFLMIKVLLILKISIYPNRTCIYIFIEQFFN